jgi:hypothetical protein
MGMPQRPPRVPLIVERVRLIVERVRVFGGCAVAG